MSGNSFGKSFVVTSFGESHGTAIGCIVDGCPPGMRLCEADLQQDLDRRKPGTSRHTTQRREDDAVQILSGVFEIYCSVMKNLNLYLRIRFTLPDVILDACFAQ